MKELSIEQKAKAYDEAIKRAKSAIKECGNNQGRIAMIESIFPELKESEDDRIRKAIIGYIDHGQHYGVSNKDMIAWLEKQGVQKPQRMISAEAKEAMYDKPAWSEEDECYMGECIGAIATKDGWSFEEKRKTKHWLKSIKDRVQPKQEWSEDDKLVVEDIEEAVIKYWHGQSQEDLLDWLKSLKGRVQPQNKWKPSDEQMTALKHAFNDCSIAFADMKILATLYEQLKALHRYEQDT